MRTRSAPSPFAAGSGPAAGAATRPSVEPGSLLALAKQRALVATRVPKFLRSLYDMLYHEDPSILAWAPDGTCFQIFDTRRLEAAVLPKYFKHSKFASFQRQLNNFGFRKWTKTQSSVCTFSHAHLVRCHPLHLAELISRHADAAPRSPAGHKRALDAVDAGDKATLTAAATESRISPRGAKQIKRELAADSEAGKSPSAGMPAGPAAWDASAAHCWALDPALFLKPEAAADGGRGGSTPMPADLASAFIFPLDDLNDLVLAAPDAYERTFELRMLNECLDLAPPSSGSFVGLLTGAGDLAPPATTAYSWSDFGRSDVTL